MLKRLMFAVVLVALCAIPPAFAKMEEPPQELLDSYNHHTIVHSKLCNFQNYKETECLLHFDFENKVLYVTLFDVHNNEPFIFLIATVDRDKNEQIVWVRSDKKA